MNASLRVPTLLLAVLLAGCPSSPTSTPTTPPMGATLSALPCPTISDPTPSCPGVALTGLSLTCSSPPSATFDSKRTNRIGVMLATGITVSGIVRGTPGVLLPNEPCHGIGANFPITITFGVDYIG